MQIFLFSFLSLCFFAFTGLRIYHLNFAIDSQTGFFNSNHISVYILFALIIISVIFYAVIYLLNKKVEMSCYEVFDKKIPLAISSGILAALFLSEGILEIINTLEMENMNGLFAFKILSCVISAMFFAMLLFKIVDKKPADGVFSLSSLGFVLWAISNMLTPFISDVAVNAISEYTFTILYYCSLCAFSMAFAKFVSGRKNIYGVLTTSSISIIFSGIMNIAPIVAHFMAKEKNQLDFDISTIVSYGIFIFLVIFNIYCGKYIYKNSEKRTTL